MTDQPRAITALEYKWARATLGTIYPAAPEAGVTQGIADMDLAGFIDELAEALPAITFFGIRLFLLLVALSPLFVIGKPRTMAGLGEKDREAVVWKIGHSDIYLVRQMVMALKATFAFFFGGGAELQAICRSAEPDRAKLLPLGRKNAA
jgi:hypothetical protein